MEPARDGRDDDYCVASVTGDNPPQWSPPVTGGTTSEIRDWLKAKFEPQWSPPVAGGTTPRGR